MANTISDKLEYLEGTKSAIKDAIVAKGVAVEDTATFRSYAEKIGEISGGGGGKIDLSEFPLSIGYSDITKFRDGGEAKLEDLFVLNKSSWESFFNGCYATRDAEFTFDCQGKNANYLFATNRDPSYITKITLLNVGDQGISLFANQPQLVEIDADLHLINYTNVFKYCRSLKVLPRLDFFNSAQNEYTFSNCSSLEEIPDITCKGAPNTSFMFENCTSLKRLGKITMSDLNPFSQYAFGYTWSSSYYLNNLTDFGGVTTPHNLYLNNLPALTSQSVDNVLEAVSDLTGTSTQTITFNSTVYAALTEEQKALATSKNWTLASA